MSAPMPGAGDPPKLKELHRQRRFGTTRAISALMLREMSTTYGRSPLGYLWAVLQPVAGIVLLTMIFSVMLRAPPMGKSFALFYATGIIPFMLYMQLQGTMSMAIGFSRPLLTYPSVTVVDAILARFLLNGLTQLLIAFIIFGALLLMYDTHAVIQLPELALGMAMALCLAGGVGVLNAFLFGIFPEWIRIWAILNRPMFLVSCVFFLFDTIPEPYQTYLWYNPIVHVVGQVRHGFYPFYEVDYVSPAYVFGISLTLLLLGLVFLRRYALYILFEA